MGQIALQLAASLPSEVIRLNTKVASIESQAVVLESGERLSGSAVVVATDASAVRTLLSDQSLTETCWRSVTTLYFAADASPVSEATICLNGSGIGQVNSVSVLSDVAPGYAPPGKSLLSVVVLGVSEESALETRVLEELVSWFGPIVKHWQHLRTDQIERALPEQLPGSIKGNCFDRFSKHGNTWLCGDHLSSASIEGAVISGKRAAESVLNTLNPDNPLE